MWNTQQLADLINERMAIDPGSNGPDPDLYNKIGGKQILDLLFTINTLTNIVFPQKDIELQFPINIPAAQSPWHKDLLVHLQPIIKP
jgi:hypothetical protein